MRLTHKPKLSNLKKKNFKKFVTFPYNKGKITDYVVGGVWEGEEKVHKERTLT